VTIRDNVLTLRYYVHAEIPDTAKEELMGPGRGQRVHDRVLAVRTWPLWGLAPWLRTYIVAVVLANLLAIGFAARLGLGSGRDLVLLGVLVACDAATIEVTRRAGENAGVIKDVHGVWELPVAILLPPVYALMVPILRLALAQWRIRQVPLHRRAFSAAVVALSYGAAWLCFHTVISISPGAMFTPGDGAPVWILAVAIAAMVQWGVNTAMMLPAFKASDPALRVRDMILARETVRNDVTELCVAVLVTFAIAINLVTIVFALPFVTLLQRSFRHTQLVNASRIDSKTGLLNAGTWEREAAAEVARAVRTRTPLALALVDIDHFKVVNDIHGHLVGDRALAGIARTFRIFLRDYDLVGRFGGEEFALLLPHTRAVDAYGIAERIREHVASTPIDVDDVPNAEPVRLTVSMGVAALGARWDATTGSQLTDLLAAADRALYQAKRAGRDQVCVVTDNAVISSPEQAGRLEPA
jgi:diguanylate cyclase (GGDEF)-like protein